jgi:lipopolysaccharide/colanic/teichoic acid biosynthesis glycosyltransferase
MAPRSKMPAKSSPIICNYVKNRTIILDMIILISTVRVVLFRAGAR